MSEVLVEDGSTYPASVTVPEDGDARNAASVVVGFQALADRCKYLVTKLGAWLTGGLIRPTGDVTYNLDLSSLTFNGNDDNNIDLGVGVQLFANGKMASHLFTAGRTGRANYKPQVMSVAASSTTLIDPRYYDIFFVLPGAGSNCNLKVDPATDGVLQVGDHFTVVSTGSAEYIDILDSAGTSMGIVKAANGFFVSATYVWCGAIPGWKIAHREAHAP